MQGPASGLPLTIHPDFPVFKNFAKSLRALAHDQTLNIQHGINYNTSHKIIHVYELEEYSKNNTTSKA